MVGSMHVSVGSDCHSTRQRKFLQHSGTTNHVTCRRYDRVIHLLYLKEKERIVAYNAKDNNKIQQGKVNYQVSSTEE